MAGRFGFSARAARIGAIELTRKADGLASPELSDDPDRLGEAADAHARRLEGEADRLVFGLGMPSTHAKFESSAGQEVECRCFAVDQRGMPEVIVEDERPQVAAVFGNRLHIGMRLQSDPTVIYGLGARFDGNLRRRDLEADGPYNSYTRGGLPPTPIALPGGASIHAVLHPVASKALYFVATGVGDGSHHFSATYAEHVAALRQFLKRTGAVPDVAITGGAK